MRVLLVSIFLVACSHPLTVSADPAVKAAAAPVVRDAEATARDVLSALARKDWAALADLAGPQGIRFTPYSWIEPTKDVVLDRAALRAVGTDPTVRTWGEWDGSGDPITMTSKDYIARFVWNADFTKAPLVLAPKTPGSLTSNQDTVYPKATIFAAYDPGGDPQYGGMDWAGLRVVLEQVGGEWRCVGILHEEWMI